MLFCIRLSLFFKQGRSFFQEEFVFTVGVNGSKLQEFTDHLVSLELNINISEAAILFTKSISGRELAGEGDFVRDLVLQPRDLSSLYVDVLFPMVKADIFSRRRDLVQRRTELLNTFVTNTDILKMMLENITTTSSGREDDGSLLAANYAPIQLALCSGDLYLSERHVQVLMSLVCPVERPVTCSLPSLAGEMGCLLASLQRSKIAQEQHDGLLSRLCSHSMYSTFYGPDFKTLCFAMASLGGKEEMPSEEAYYSGLLDFLKQPLLANLIHTNLFPHSSVDDRGLTFTEQQLQSAWAQASAMLLQRGEGVPSELSSLRNRLAAQLGMESATSLTGFLRRCVKELLSSSGLFMSLHEILFTLFSYLTCCRSAMECVYNYHGSISSRNSIKILRELSTTIRECTELLRSTDYVQKSVKLLEFFHSSVEGEQPNLLNGLTEEKLQSHLVASLAKESDLTTPKKEEEMDCVSERFVDQMLQSLPNTRLNNIEVLVILVLLPMRLSAQASPGKHACNDLMISRADLDCFLYHTICKVRYHSAFFRRFHLLSLPASAKPSTSSELVDCTSNRRLRSWGYTFLSSLTLEIERDALLIHLPCNEETGMSTKRDPTRESRPCTIGASVSKEQGDLKNESSVGVDVNSRSLELPVFDNAIAAGKAFTVVTTSINTANPTISQGIGSSSSTFLILNAAGSLDKSSFTLQLHVKMPTLATVDDEIADEFVESVLESLYIDRVKSALHLNIYREDNTHSSFDTTL